MMDKNKDTTLEMLERGVQMMVTNKFWDVLSESEQAPEYRAKIISLIGRALGETFGKIEYPTYWQRFIRRRDCPKYMKHITVASARAYYPRLLIPTEKHWLTFDKYSKDQEGIIKKG